MHLFTTFLLQCSDDKYKAFSQKLTPDTKRQIIGVKTPIIKKFAKDAYKKQLSQCLSFLSQEHVYHEEWLLHSFLLSQIKDIDELFYRLNEFVPNIDNWAVCDCTVMAIKLFKKHPKKTLEFVKQCLFSNKPYAIRFGLVILLSYFLDENFEPEILNIVLSIKSEHYYVNMGLAWLYSIALIKQYDSVIHIFQNKVLPKLVHNKSIQKAIESFRISSEIKTYLRTLKI